MNLGVKVAKHNKIRKQGYEKGLKYVPLKKRPSTIDTPLRREKAYLKSQIAIAMLEAKEPVLSELKLLYTSTQNLDKKIHSGLFSQIEIKLNELKGRI